MKRKYIFFSLLFSLMAIAQVSAQTKLSLSSTVSPKDKEVNIAIISEKFGQPVQRKAYYLWEKQGAGYRYTLRLRPKKISLRYTGKSIQVERKIRQVYKKIVR